MSHKIVLLIGLLAAGGMWGCTIMVQGGAGVPPVYGPPAYSPTLPIAIGAPAPEYTGGDARWLTACEPPSCYEFRTSGGGLGVQKSGRLVGTRGVPLVRSGHEIRNNKIVPIK